MLELNDAALESVTGGWGHSQKPSTSYTVNIQLNNFSVSGGSEIVIEINF